MKLVYTGSGETRVLMTMIPNMPFWRRASPVAHHFYNNAKLQCFHQLCESISLSYHYNIYFTSVAVFSSSNLCSKSMYAVNQVSTVASSKRSWTRSCPSTK